MSGRGANTLRREAGRDLRLAAWVGAMTWTLAWGSSAARADRGDTGEAAQDPTARSAGAVAGADPLAGHFRRSYLSEGSADFPSAIAAMDAVLAEDATDYVAQLRRGWLLYRAGRHEDAREAYARARNLRPEAVEPILGAMLPAMAERRWREAEHLGHEALARAPCDFTALSRLAWIDYVQGRWVRAESRYRQALRLFPADLEMAIGLAWTLLQLGRASEAAPLFAMVRRVSPDDPRGWR